MFTTRKSSPPALRANVSLAQVLPLFARLVYFFAALTFAHRALIPAMILAFPAGLSLRLGFGAVLAGAAAPLADLILAHRA